MSLTGVKTQPLLRGNLITMSQWQALFGQAGWRLYPYQLGAMVRTAFTTGNLQLHGLGQLAANNYLLPCTATAYGDGTLYIPALSKLTRVATVSTTDDVITISPEVTLAVGDYLLNLGNDGAAAPLVAPSYDGSTCRLKTDPAGNAPSAGSEATYIATASNGQFQGWVVDANGDPTFEVVDLLITNGSSVPQVVLPLYQLGPAIR